MAVIAGSGIGTTITFADGYTATIRRVGATTLSRDALDTTKINQSIGAGKASVVRSFVPSGAFDPGQFEVECIFTGDANLAEIDADPGSITITYPTNFDTDSTLAGTGFILEAGTPECTIDDAMVYNLTIKWDGESGPLWS